MRRWVTCAWLGALVWTTTLANAQMSDGEKKAAARAAFMEGVALQDQGDAEEALSRFEAAQALFDAPTHLLHIAECQALLGKLVEASETYETLARKPLDKTAPTVFVQAQEQGKAELVQLRSRIPTLRVTVKPEPASLRDLQIVVNDKLMPVELLEIARPVNPGHYTLSATAAGWATQAPIELDVQEKEARDVELTMHEGASGAGGSVKDAPPLYEKNDKHVRPTGPSQNGLLLGIRPALFVPLGNVTKDLKFRDYAKAGAGVGLDVIGRVARFVLIGGTLEYASLGSPDNSSLPAGSKAEIGTDTFYVGILAGIMPNVDRVTFVADAGLGMRILSRSLTLTTPTGESGKADETYSGLELALAAGVSVPVGPLRLVPKAGFSFGRFTDRECGVNTTTTLTGCIARNDIDASSHVVLSLALGLYYHLDLGKKSASARALPFTFAAR